MDTARSPMREFFPVLTLFFGSCSMTSFLPVGGAIIGGGAGSLVGPGGAAIGAGAGAATGQILAGDKKLKEAKETIEALTTGDVDALVKKRMEEARDGGFFDSILDEFYGLMKLVCLGLILWNAVPLLWTYMLKREVMKNGNDSQV